MLVGLSTAPFTSLCRSVVVIQGVGWGRRGMTSTSLGWPCWLWQGHAGQKFLYRGVVWCGGGRYPHLPLVACCPLVRPCRSGFVGGGGGRGPQQPLVACCLLVRPCRSGFVGGGGGRGPQQPFVACCPFVRPCRSIVVGGGGGGGGVLSSHWLPAAPPQVDSCQWLPASLHKPMHDICNTGMGLLICCWLFAFPS